MMRQLTGAKSSESVASVVSDGWEGPDGIVPFWRNSNIMKNMTLQIHRGCPPDMAALMMDVRFPQTYDEMWESGTNGIAPYYLRTPYYLRVDM